MARSWAARLGRASLALLPLPWLACALPTPLGELPAMTTTSDGTDATSIATDPTGPGFTTTLPETTTGGTGPLPMHAWVMRYDDWLALDGGTSLDSGGIGSGGGGTETSPDALVVQISTAPDDCTNPLAPMECGNQWVIFMVIPPELQVPGSYDLFEQLSAFFTVTGTLEDGSCSGGAGSLVGTAELTTVSAQEVRGLLSMTEAFDFDANVEFVALGCNL